MERSRDEMAHRNAMNGALLRVEHRAPLRLYSAGKLGYKMRWDGARLVGRYPGGPQAP